MPKKDRKVWMCINYQYLNKASSEDNFPFPHVDVLVDNITRNAIFSFMNCFCGCNQVKMDPEDMEKTTFITLWDTFYYKVMPFGLKKAWATYRKMMVTLLHDMMHKKVEVCVDDIIAKSKSE